MPKRQPLTEFLKICALLCVVIGAGCLLPTSFAADSPYRGVVDLNVARAESEVARISDLVERGVLPKKRLSEAEDRLSDVRDDSVLSQTLYGGTRVQDLTPAQAADMIAAAKRRLERQEAVVRNRMSLVNDGVLAKSEVQPAIDELEMRKRTLQLSEERAKLLDDLLQMARVEESLAQARSLDLAKLQNVMIRYEGAAPFDLALMKKIGDAYQLHFHQELPISAVGQTLVHQQLGFDHRGRVDVAINPDTTEGLWLRHLLETKHLSYIAFRSSLLGSATGPHIHIGPGSLRVRSAPQPDVQLRVNQVRVSQRSNGVHTGS
jgi:hypothetical protein